MFVEGLLCNLSDSSEGVVEDLDVFICSFVAFLKVGSEKNTIRSTEFQYQGTTTSLGMWSSIEDEHNVVEGFRRDQQCSKQ